MKPSIVVYTCLTAARDPIREDQYISHDQHQHRFIAFVDAPVQSEVWKQMVLTEQQTSSRRTARYVKLLPHRHVDADISLWQDANVALRVSPSRLCDDWLANCDLAVFQHRTRSCLYEEARVCKEKLLDDPILIDNQISRYRASGIMPNLGLAETSVVLRRHSKRMDQFNELWWNELSRGSVRDQISFMVVAQQSGIKVRLITPTKFHHPYFSMTVRPPGSEKAVNQSVSVHSPQRAGPASEVASVLPRKP